jgi:UDP-2,3-diacylglucosamine hydrolase
MVTAPRAQELQAPPAWRAIDLISDLHLQAAQPATVAAWQAYLAATPADAVFILGDLFEAWIGDDAAGVPGFEADCFAVLRAAAAHRPLFFLPGNRDFLGGEGLPRATGVTLLADPTVLAFGGSRWLLSHGDALCLGDTEYLRFRAQVRTPGWVGAVLARPLAERRALASTLRGESEAQKRSGRDYADVDTEAALQWLRAADAGVLVHGHTHRPGEHRLDADHRRIVLSDWDAEAVPPRLEALRITADGAVRRIAPA